MGRIISAFFYVFALISFIGLSEVITESFGRSVVLIMLTALMLLLGKLSEKHIK